MMVFAHVNAWIKNSRSFSLSFLLLFVSLSFVRSHLIESNERKSFYLSHHALMHFSSELSLSLSLIISPPFSVFGEHIDGSPCAIKTVKRAVSTAKQQHDVSSTERKINFFFHFLRGIEIFL